LRGRIARLEERDAGPNILAVSLQESGLTAPEYHWCRALALATAYEMAELERCHAAAEEARPYDSAEEFAYLEIAETIMSREAETLANDFRIRRDLLWRELTRLRREWEGQGRNRSTRQSDRPCWALSTAQANRRTAVNRGAPLITKPEEAERLIEQITDPATTTKEVLGLIGWQG
jgi:hypothetical protein